MKSPHVVIFLLFLGAGSLCAQPFSQDKSRFRNEALGKIKAIGTEPALKIAFDFQNAWDGKFTEDQQTTIHQMALKMQKKGYSFYPYFYHYFAYLAYAVKQENLQTHELSNVLEINEQALATLQKSAYKEFLFGLNIFLARRYLSLSKNLTVQADGGSYAFLQLGEAKEEIAIENPADTLPILLDDTSIASDDASWSDDDSWGSDDSWGNDDSWGDDSSWDSDDDWGDDEAWGDDDSSGWDEPATPSKPTKPVRPEYIVGVQDFVAQKQSQYIGPIIEGPAIKLINGGLDVATRFDTLKIKSLEGHYLLKDRTLAGTQGVVSWPSRHEKLKGAEVVLSDFHLRKDRADFWTPHAKLKWGRLGGSPISGVFEYKGRTRNDRKASGYPIFTSNSADIELKLNDDRLSYTGGLELRGNKLLGKSVSKENGSLIISDQRGHYIILKSKEFALGDSLVSMDQGTMTIVHGADSIFHKSVRAKYDLRNQQFKALRNNALMPFGASYFDMNIQVDLITWDLNVDSIALEIMNGKDRLPATFESSRYFNDIRYAKLSRALDFHPLNAAVTYALKYDLNAFYVGELAAEYKINENFAKAAGNLLAKYGFAEYEAQTGYLKLYPRAFHYYYASARKVDFDNLLVPSKISSGANAYIQLDSGKLNVNGVERFYLTSDYKIYAEPQDGQMTLLRGKDLTFDGMVHAGDFEFQGQDHLFQYDEFIFDMPVIDSMKLTVPLAASEQDTTRKMVQLQNEITSSSGILYVEEPNNKSGRIKNAQYPYFSANSESSIVYFDGPEILSGAYDKSVKFIMPAFQIDSIERQDGRSISFEGKFVSGNIFPDIEETLNVQSDGSLGFTHEIPPEGYPLYGTEARTYKEIKLNNNGLRGYGQIDFLNATIYSDDFIYYPDSVTTIGTQGIIKPGTSNGTSFPEARLGAFDMHWLPRKDSMYLKTIAQPFAFYDGTAQLSEGFVNVTSKGVLGSGTLSTRGSRSVSKNLSFEEFEYRARHASFEVLTEDPMKPAMAGDDVKLTFDLRNNTAMIGPEVANAAAISFPYTQMKTSITHAIWDLEDSLVFMMKPEAIPLEESYFYTTKEELDSLVFNGEKAFYDMKTKELTVKGVPYIRIADAKIVPEGNQITFLADAVTNELNNAEIIIDGYGGYRYLNRANIRILSRNQFEGDAIYQHYVEKDTFNIRFDSFELQDVPTGVNKKGKKITTQMTVSGGEVPETQNFLIAPGFLFKGTVTMYATKPALALDGFIKVNTQNISQTNWIPFERTADNPNLTLTIDSKTTAADGSQVVAGLNVDTKGALYPTLLGKTRSAFDETFFAAEGRLSFDHSLRQFRIETPSKARGDTYEGTTLIYNDSTQDWVFEGMVSFINADNKQLEMKTSVLGVGNSETGAYMLDAMFSLDFDMPATAALDTMAFDLLEIVETVGPPIATDVEKSEFLYKFANFHNDQDARAYQEVTLRKYLPLFVADPSFETPLFVSGVKLKWDPDHKAWHNTTKIGLSHIFQHDINAKLDGFLEIKKDDTGADVIHLFIQPAPGVWYYMSYTQNQLLFYSSNQGFNEQIKLKSNADNSRPGEMIMALGSEAETLAFVNAFRADYFGLEEPYDLSTPDEIEDTAEKETPTEEEEEDDGFGFD